MIYFYDYAEKLVGVESLQCRFPFFVPLLPEFSEPFHGHFGLETAWGGLLVHGALGHGVALIVNRSGLDGLLDHLAVSVQDAFELSLKTKSFGKNKISKDSILNSPKKLDFVKNQNFSIKKCL